MGAGGSDESKKTTKPGLGHLDRRRWPCPRERRVRSGETARRVVHADARSGRLSGHDRPSAASLPGRRALALRRRRRNDRSDGHHQHQGDPRDQRDRGAQRRPDLGHRAPCTNDRTQTPSRVRRLFPARKSDNYAFSKRAKRCLATISSTCPKKEKAGSSPLRSTATLPPGNSDIRAILAPPFGLPTNPWCRTRFASLRTWLSRFRGRELRACELRFGQGACGIRSPGPHRPLRCAGKRDTRRPASSLPWLGLDSILGGGSMHDRSFIVGQFPSGGCFDGPGCSMDLSLRPPRSPLCTRQVECIGEAAAGTDAVQTGRRLELNSPEGAVYRWRQGSALVLGSHSSCGMHRAPARYRLARACLPVVRHR